MRFLAAIGVVCFDDRLGAFEASDEAHRLTSAIYETFYCYRQCMFSVPFYKHFRTPMYKRFEKASDEMRRFDAKLK